MVTEMKLCEGHQTHIDMDYIVQYRCIGFRSLQLFIERCNTVVSVSNPPNPVIPLETLTAVLLTFMWV